METIILVSVLSTLGVVGIVGSVLVAFNKLRGKVDVADYESHIRELQDRIDSVVDNTSREIDSVRNELYRNGEHLEQMIDKRENEVRQSIDESFRFTDSRCDKLYAEMHNLNQ